MFNINHKELNSLGKEIDSLFNEVLAHTAGQVKPISNKYYANTINGVTFSSFGDWSVKLYKVDFSTIKVAIRLAGESKESIKAVLSDHGNSSKLHVTGTIDENLSFIKSPDSKSVDNNHVDIFYSQDDYSLADIKYVSGYLVCTLTRLGNEYKVNTKEIPVL